MDILPILPQRMRWKTCRQDCSKQIFMVEYFWQFINNGFLDWHYERLCFTLFHMFPFYTLWNYPSNLWFSDVFREHKRGTLGRNKSRFSTHFSPVFFFCTACKHQLTLGLLFFLGSRTFRRNGWNYVIYVSIYAI